MFFHFKIGGSGRLRLSVIPTDSEGYSTHLLRSATSNGKNVVYIIPLQEQLCTLPLPYDCAEFSKMPQSQCMTCGTKMPLQLLPLHVEGCNGTTTVSYHKISAICQKSMYFLKVCSNISLDFSFFSFFFLKRRLILLHAREMAQISSRQTHPPQRYRIHWR